MFAVILATPYVRVTLEPPPTRATVVGTMKAPLLAFTVM